MSERRVHICLRCKTASGRVKRLASQVLGSQARRLAWKLHDLHSRWAAQGWPMQCIPSMQWLTTLGNHHWLLIGTHCLQADAGVGADEEGKAVSPCSQLSAGPAQAVDTSSMPLGAAVTATLAQATEHAERCLALVLTAEAMPGDLTDPH